MRIPTKILMLFSTLILMACSGPSLEKYYVENQDQEDFIVMNIPSSTLITDSSQLSEEEKNTLKSVEKANILAFPLTEMNKVVYEEEKTELEDILYDEKYKLLMKFGSAEQQFRLMYLGESESIDEIILYGSSDEMGFGVARILGKNMNPGEIMQLLKSMDGSNINLEGMEQIKNAIESKKVQDSLETS